MKVWQADSLEKRVGYGVCCRNALFWHPLQTLFDEICGLCKIFESIAWTWVAFHKFYEVYLSLGLAPLEQLHHWRLTYFFQLFHFLSSRISLNLGLFQDLETFSFTREEWRPRDQFEEDAARRPNVNAAVVLITPQDQLGCAVVSRNHIGGIQPGGIQHLCSTQVSNF